MILQKPREEELRFRLAQAGVTARFVPRLASTDAALNGQPAAATLKQALRARRHLVLDGVAGAGKTVLALQLALDADLEAAFLDAPAWAPTGTDLRQSFLRTAGTNLETAEEAFQSGRLVLILDAIDEAPWRAGAIGTQEALAHLAREVAGKAGLLVTSRTSGQVGPLPSPTTYVSLGGIDPGDAEDFVSHYRGSRSRVATLIEGVRTLDLPAEIKYSPLILRALADGLELPPEPHNATQLFSGLADFHISRECAKPRIQGTALTPDSWQAAYSDKPRHQNLVCALLFGSGAGRILSEEEFSRAAEDCLSVKLHAYDLVGLSTLMSQHPLVTVAHSRATYDVRATHDWARTGMLPRFLSYEAIDALPTASEWWLDSLPIWEDFADSWNWLDSAGHADSMLEYLLDLASEPSEAQRAASWLSPQMFHPALEGTSVQGKLYACVASLAGRFAKPGADLTDLLGLASLVPYELRLAGLELRLSKLEQVGSWGQLVLDSCTLQVEEAGPAVLTLRDSTLISTDVSISNDCHLVFDGCYLDRLTVTVSGTGTVAVTNCIYDPKTCHFPSTAMITNSGHIADRYWPWLLAQVLRRLVVTAPVSYLSRPRHMVNVENVLKGPIRGLRSDAEKVLEVMERLGYVTVTPTGPSVKRITPTREFDASQAAKFVSSAERGAMTEAILAKLSS